MKRLVILLLAATTAVSAPAAPGNGARTRIDKDWTLAREGAPETYPASVPSTVAGTLYEAGYFGEGLLEGKSYKTADRTIFDEPWTYKTVFKGKVRRGQHAELVFDGLNFYADIFLNGKQIASADTTYGVFIRRAYDASHLLKGLNTLEIKLKRAQKGDLNIGFVDWNPRPLDESMGIVRPVTLHTTGAISIEDIYVIPELEIPSLAQAELRVSVTLRNLEQKPVKTILKLDLEGVGTARIPVSLSAGETRRVELTPAEATLLHLDQPRVWWSHDLGTPELYRLAVAAEVKGRLSDRMAIDFGVRRIESRLTDENYRQMTLNGKDILIKGAGWTDDIFLRDTPESIDRQVRQVMDMNLNLIRFENIWGKDDTVYDLCDRLGVLALVGFSCQWEWEDYCGLPEVKGYGCINDPRSEALAERYFHDQVVRLHNHPSIIAWMTGSDRVPNPGLEERYFAIYKQEDYRPYICSASDKKSLAGRSGTKMEGPYEYVGPDYWYKDTQAGGAYGWNTETGIGANIAQLESIRRMIPEQDLWPLSDSWDFHCTAASSAMHSTEVLQEVVKGQYGGWKDLEDFVRKAHAVDYDGTRAMFEAFRVRVPQATGIVQWMLNSAWPSLYWQLYDWYGVPTAGYYGTKKGCEPRQLLFDFADRKVYAVNESLETGALTAVVTVFDAASNVLFSDKKPVSPAYREVVPVFDLKPFDGKPHFVALQLIGADGKPVADNFYCIPARDNEYKWKKTNWYITPITSYADLGFVFEGGKADVDVTVEPAPEGYSVTLANRSGRIVPMNILKARGAAGELVVPAWWSDNFFALLPGQTKTVTCRVEKNGTHIELD